MDRKRRQFLRGGTPGPLPLRPPWSLPEEEFVERCTGCEDCIRACPEGILKPGPGQLPVIDFAAGSCTFCGSCREVCKAEAFFAAGLGREAWTLRASIGSSCLEYQGVSCRICGDACGERAICFRSGTGGFSEPMILSETCTGCGACVTVCPVAAIDMADANPMAIQGAANESV